VQFRVNDSISLVARGTNLLDEQYEQVYGYRTLGRAGYLGIRADFGQSR
jgi:vitamin B12 transporter